MALLIAGLGIKFVSHLTIETEKIIKYSDKVLFLTNDDAYPDYLTTINTNTESLNPIYFSTNNRTDSYKKIEKKILEELLNYNNVCVIVYGHPTFLVQAIPWAAKSAENNGYEVRVLPGISSLDCLFADLKINPGDGGLQMLEATELLAYKKNLDITSHIVILQIAAIGLNDTIVDQHVSKAGFALLLQYLKKYYTSDQEVVLYEASQYPGVASKIHYLSLKDLDANHISAITSLYIPPSKKAEKNTSMIEQIKSLMRNHDTTSEEFSV